VSTWLIRLNGAPLMEITAPSYMNPDLMAREVLLHGEPDRADVTVAWKTGEGEGHAASASGN
jgi:hypothetical protein